MSHDPRTTTNVLKVSANGNDTYPNEYGYATIGAALAVASAGDKVEVAAGGYAENITIPADVEVDAGGAILTGTITVNDGSRITLLRQNALTATTGASLTGASAIAYVAIARQDCAGTAVGAVCLTASAHLHFGVRQQTLSTGYGVGPTTAGYVHLGIEHMEINGAGTGLAATTNGRLHGFVGGIIDGGAAEGIRLMGSAIADLTIGHVETDTALHLDDTASANLTVGNVTGATTAYDVAVGATLNLVTSNLSGAAVGTANVIQAGSIAAHEAKRIDQGHAVMTLAQLNGHVSDATLDDVAGIRTPTAHGIGGSRHNASTIALLNSKISDATLDDITGARTPTAHTASHGSAGGDALTDLAGTVTLDAGATTLAEIGTNTSARHTQGTDAALDTGGGNEFTAAQGKGLQDALGAVTALKDEDDMASDSATAVASQQSVKAYVDDTVQPTREWEADLSGTYDWKTNGAGSTDTTSGISCDDGWAEPGDIADFTTLEVGGGVITFDVSGTGQDVDGVLEIALTDLPDLDRASAITITMDVDLNDDATNFDTADDVFWSMILNGSAASAFPSPAESSGFSIANIGGVLNLRMLRYVNDGATFSADAITNPKNSGTVWMADRPGDQTVQFHDGAGNLTTGGFANSSFHARSGSSYFVIWMRAKNGGRVAGTISSIKVTVR